MKITKQQKKLCKSVSAIVLTLFYVINVQSVQNDLQKQMARQDELEMREVGLLERTHAFITGIKDDG